MKLATYLKANRITHTEFTKRCSNIGFDISMGAVAKWCNGQRIPRYKEMQVIYKVTDGNVNPNDFYDLPIAN